MAQNTFLHRFLARIEKLGNALPNPAILFLILTLIVIFISGIMTWVNFQAIHPVTKELLTPVNLLSSAGLRHMITETVKNFTGFAPMGTVLVAMLGFSISEKSGLLTTLLRLIVLKSSKKLLVPAVLLAGVLSHTGGDIGYVLLIPLAGLTFHSAGLNPIAGITICFAGVSGGFAANILLSTADTLLSGISQEAAKILNPQYSVTPLSNYYFMATSSLLIIAIGTFIANKITIPFLGKYKGDKISDGISQLTAKEKKGLFNAGIIALILVLFLLIGLVPSHGFLRDPANPDILHSAAIKGIVAIIFLFGALPGLVYGYTVKTFKNQNDVINAMQEAMATMAPYLVLVFFASQFVQMFNHSHMGLIVAVKGSEVLKDLGLGPIPLMLGFIILTVFLDLIIGSASAKWALMAPIFVPMFMLLGISPELSQTSYRIADSVVNIISPLMPYFPLVLAFMAKYDPKAKVGTVIALMLPYSMGFLIFWSLMLFAWISLGLPLGPGAPLTYIAP
jgi:aminobenzoyl-glutamate transport protein